LADLRQLLLTKQSEGGKGNAVHNYSNIHHYWIAIPF